MNLGSKTIEKLAKLLSTSPQLQQITEQENQRRNFEATRARLICLENLCSASKELERATERSSKAGLELDAVRKDIRLMEERALSELSIADEELRNARRRYSAINSMLSREHGEGLINSALLTLHSLKNQEDRRLCGHRNNVTEKTKWGTIRIRPGEQEKIDRSIDSINSISKSDAELRSLLLSETAPHEIKERVSRILKRHGIIPDYSGHLDSCMEGGVV